MPDDRHVDGREGIPVTGNPVFSVIIPTRNRPEMFRRALDSVLRQSFRNIEILVVNDGSAPEFLPAYHAIEANCDARVHWFCQPARPNGHGPSYSINTGAQAARGQYLCILDDDDSWEDMEHLAVAWHVMQASSETVDVYYSNQRAYCADGKPIEKPMWLGILAARLPADSAGAHGTYRVAPAFLLSCNGFPHLNCTIIHRELYQEIGGMDEGIRYECEVDLYLRTLNAASLIIYNPREVARHNVPDAVARNSVSTAVTLLHKRLSQIGVYQKNLARAPTPTIRDVCRNRLAMLYKSLAEYFAREKEYVIAATYAQIALGYGASLKWRWYSLYLSLMAALKKQEKRN
ncbi:MAG: glycosyltransferase [Porticoccaceae bacterium]